MKINLDKVVAVVAGLAAAVLPVLVQDKVLSGTLADVLGTVVAFFVVGYHVPSGKVFGGKPDTKQTQS